MLSVLQKAIRPVSRSRDIGRPRVVVDPGMRRRLLLGNRDISGPSLRSFARTAPGRPEAEADDGRTREEDVSAFSGPREFAAFLGLTPRQNSSGGKEQLGRISKMGNRYLRTLLVVGAHAVLYHRKRHEDALRSFAKKLIQTKPFKLVAVALANKMARIAFALMAARQAIAQIRRDHRHRQRPRAAQESRVTKR